MGNFSYLFGFTLVAIFVIGCGTGYFAKIIFKLINIKEDKLNNERNKVPSRIEEMEKTDKQGEEH